MRWKMRGIKYCLHAMLFGVKISGDFCKIWKRLNCLNFFIKEMELVDSVFLIVCCKMVTLRAENMKHNPKSGKVNGERKWSNVFFSCIENVDVYLYFFLVQTE